MCSSAGVCSSAGMCSSAGVCSSVGVCRSVEPLVAGVGSTARGTGSILEERTVTTAGAVVTTGANGALWKQLLRDALVQLQQLATQIQTNECKKLQEFHAIK